MGKSTNNVKQSRFYSWGYIAYGDESNIARFCREQGRNWAYVLHDKDLKEDGTTKEPHYHVVITFEQQKSFASAVRIAKEYLEGNVMAEAIADLGGALLYLTHETDSAIADGKYQYDREIVRYSSKDFYTKYVKGEEVSENEQFVEDLLCHERDFSVIKMAKRYGRDFIKNVRSYMDFRLMALAELSGINPIHYHTQAFSTEERFAIDRNANECNNFLKG